MLYCIYSKIRERKSYMNTIIEFLKTTIAEAGIPEETLTLITTYLFYVLLATSITLVLFAFWGYKIFKAFLPIVGAAGFGTVGYMLIAPLVTKALGESLTIGIDIPVVIGWACAIIGAILMGSFLKFALFVEGAGIGFVVGAYVFNTLGALNPTVAFLQGDVGYYIVSGLAALILALIFVFLFKYIYIFITSVGGLAIVGGVLGLTLMSELNPIVLYVAAGVGAIVGIFAMVFQLRRANY